MESGCRLNKLLGDVVISQGGVVPHIAPVCHVNLLFIGDYLIRLFSGTSSWQIGVWHPSYSLGWYDG